MIGARIQKLRHQKRMSLTELAARAGVAKSYLSSIERDLQSNPSIQFLRKLAPVLGVNVQTLILHDPGEKQEQLDQEWVQIIQEFNELGLSKDSLRKIVRQLKTRQAVTYEQAR
ncbi:XRE family transcriptional regulator [Paenibacillus mucilaginosus]|uniref:Transcriptional regulator n=3 Tax=Paenibacillus mucilaginosus TaxID=61624 RepID=H6NE12_9BACL|nr:XRE family transcriptional regulator [Paenibacillus mucilaginosus]AEI45227.1 transcriptional regulator [Paenibacillus mucilaginosus KNP414]AFC32965.1 transcriptional regulator [Paenibacillus mucilaginosus 3016]AFH65277.1 transcriptional regulator [Paenibacillus mucilaginosus K02]MCG7212884.1 helix-turn-helix domain-containing protein [Paenibacillus mucilaginosus]WDM26698.1 helix-turn-helix domain-containing protein [Paenibacillus mucilaginosus]